MKESLKKHPNIVRRLAYTAIGGGLLVGSIGAFETMTHDTSDGLRLVGISTIPIGLGTSALLIDDKEKKLYQQRRERFINSTILFGTNFDTSTKIENPNIIEGEYRVIEPSETSEPPKPDQG